MNAKSRFLLTPSSTVIIILNKGEIADNSAKILLPTINLTEK